MYLDTVLELVASGGSQGFWPKERSVEVVGSPCLWAANILLMYLFFPIKRRYNCFIFWKPTCCYYCHLANVCFIYHPLAGKLSLQPPKWPPGEVMFQQCQLIQLEVTTHMVQHRKTFFFHFFWCFSLHILVDLAWLCSNLWDGENMLRPLWHRILIIIHTIYLIFCSYMNLISHLNMGGVSLVFNVKCVFWFSSETWLHATPHDSIHNLLRIVQLSTIWPLFPNSLCAKSFCLC